MRVFIVQDGDHFVKGVYSTFEKAKNSIRKNELKHFNKVYAPSYTEEEVNEILAEFEETGCIDEVVYIEECEIDEMR